MSSTKSAKLELVSHDRDSVFGRLHYLGPPSRTSHQVLVMLHGFGSNSEVWLPLLAAARQQNLLTGIDTILLDLPGFGRSDNVLRHLDSREVGQTVLDLVRDLGYDDIRLAGHSMGGFLALDLAANTDAISSVHLVAGSYFSLIEVSNRPYRSLVSSFDIASFYLFQQAISHSRLLTAAVNELWSHGRSDNRRLYKLGGRSFTLAARNGRGYDARRIWATITAPVYAVFGGNDRLVTAMDMETLHKILPGAKTTLIPGAGHSLLVTHPEAAARAIFPRVLSQTELRAKPTGHQMPPTGP